MVRVYRIVEHTFLNVLRLMQILPKILNSTGSWTKVKMCNTILRVSIGIKYHFNWPNTILISSNAKWTLSPNSQIPNNKAIVMINWTNKPINFGWLTFLSWCWKRKQNWILLFDLCRFTSDYYFFFLHNKCIFLCV